MLNEDIIPITYFAGTVGNFLCHLLVSAKLNQQILPPISTTGNAHRGLKDLSFRYEWNDKDESFIIKSLASTSFNRPDSPPYFIPLHLTNITLINEYFKKSIRITFDLDDTEEITTIFYKKFYLTNDNKQKIKGIENIQDLILNARIGQHAFRNTNQPNVLFISWKEYFKENIEDLILKLSSYTNINADNFSRESIVLWRTATQSCLENNDNTN